MVLGDASQQLGPSLLILGRFFFPSMGLGIDMKWTGLCQILQPHNNNKNLKKKKKKRWVGVKRSINSWKPV